MLSAKKSNFKAHFRDQGRQFRSNMNIGTSFVHIFPKMLLISNNIPPLVFVIIIRRSFDPRRIRQRIHKFNLDEHKKSPGFGVSMKLFKKTLLHKALVSCHLPSP